MKEEKLTGRGKAKLVIRYLRPVVWLFALGLLMSFFSSWKRRSAYTRG